VHRTVESGLYVGAELRAEKTTKEEKKVEIRERRWSWPLGVCYRKPSHDQCGGAFIVLQQKGAHQSSGISSRLISRSLAAAHGETPSVAGNPGPSPYHYHPLLPLTCPGAEKIVLREAERQGERE
jgi:hypothetical protein